MLKFLNYLLKILTCNIAPLADWAGKVSEIGYGMWGMGGQWKGGTDAEAVAALIRADELGCTFFDTAWIYGEGHSEQLFSRAYPKFNNKKVRIATKVPPKNLQWPARPEYDIRDTFPAELMQKLRKFRWDREPYE